ncbi:molybdenum cofactor biosynthesis protein B [Pseudomaricurvus sp. HS19]|uniref:molybdenum cofactor biosynthesis protein B n=1 Tax=Pseudomaricurvus sp. HS19 TaxID=2692626 RepID=UPI00136AD286|nr:molybdenum cofactor biosynthesis protein B [Pseudomaricurvus sp. HS19]MYM63101.1 molybdenum cofactor biosynthesis protein B [Pseudomaricurvus sp. HS19]
MSDFTPLNLTVLTVSDTRTEATDTSGQLLRHALHEAGHSCVDHAIVKDDIYQIRAVASRWIADELVHGILITGGTGFHGRDSTPEAMLPLFDKTIDGFGELFRQVSFEQIGSSTIQSRCVGGIANRTVIFCLPGSNNACQTGWDQIIKPQLDSRQKPCNFVGLITQR